jgi:sortase A
LKILILRNGNIGLAAHNRGYPVNYFKNIKSLKIGDEIFYQYNDYEAIYKVTKSVVIKDTDWSYLGKTKGNTITLITCVENEPSYRRCVQAVKID